MPDNFISGDTGFVALGATNYNFKKWRFPIDGGTKKFFAFGSNFQRTLQGPIAAQITCEGAYNQSNMALTIGTVYALHLGWMTAIELTVSARLAAIEYSNEIAPGGEPGGQITCTFESDGVFTIVFT